MGQGEILFKTKTIPGEGSPKLVPATTGFVNVVKDFSWTLSPIRNEVPTIKLFEYELKQSGLVSAANRFAYALQRTGEAIEDFRKGSVHGDKPYYGLYPSDPTGFVYNLPYFSEQYRAITNGWEDSDILAEIPLISRLPIAGPYMGFKGLGALAKPFNVGVGHEIQKAYSQGSAEQLLVAFALLNTTNIDDVKKNWSLQYLLSYQNLQNRRNFVLVNPPVIYRAQIDGVKYSPAMYVSNLAITNLGQSKRLLIDSHIHNIPEAYGIVITLQDLIPQSQNMLDAMRTEKWDKIITTEGGPKEFDFWKDWREGPPHKG